MGVYQGPLPTSIDNQGDHFDVTYDNGNADLNVKDNSLNIGFDVEHSWGGDINIVVKNNNTLRWIHSKNNILFYHFILSQLIQSCRRHKDMAEPVDHYHNFRSYSAGIDFRCQNMTSTDVRF